MDWNVNLVAPGDKCTGPLIGPVRDDLIYLSRGCYLWLRTVYSSPLVIYIMDKVFVLCLCFLIADFKGLMGPSWGRIPDR